MNKQIRAELEKITATQIEFDENTTSIFIPKTTSWNLTSLRPGRCYLIELSDSLLNPVSNSALASNWNGGKTPKHKYYNVEIQNIMNKMIQVIGVGIIEGAACGEQFYGWLPFEQIKVLQEL